MQFDPKTFKPRNSFVLVKLHVHKKDKVGKVLVPDGYDQSGQCEGTILAVGRDTIDSAGGEYSTHDLKPGQRVYIQYQDVAKDRHGKTIVKLHGMPLIDSVTKESMMLFEQANILAILAEPGEALPPSQAETTGEDDKSSIIIT